MSVDYLLHESGVGYAIFKVRMQADSVGQRLKEVQEQSQDLAKFGKMVELVSFAPFQGAAQALENANLVSEGIMSDYLKTVLEANMPKASKKNKTVLGVTDRGLAGSIKAGFPSLECETSETSEVCADLLRGLRLHAEKLLKQLQIGDVDRAQLGLGHAYSRAKVKFSVQKNDNHIIQAIATIDHLDKATNLFSMRVREWYGWHFPELVKVVSDNTKYAQLALLIKDKKELTEDNLHDIAAIVDDDEAVARSILDAAKVSMGQDISDADMENVMAFAERVVSLNKYRKSVGNYLVSKMSIVAPNLAALIGETVGARLISKAGSLTNLAKYPASTVQILGAEKALFRALKTKGNTPKFGIIYHSSFIGRAGAKNKGRISRFLANKTSIASRIDNFSETPTTKFGEALKAQVEERLNFYATGEAPTKNEQAMQAAMNAVLGDINIADPTAGASEDVEMADGVTSAATEQAVRKEKSKDEKKKDKKDKKRKSVGADSDDEADKKEKKKKRKSEGVDGDKKEKKKSRKSIKRAAPASGVEQANKKTKQKQWRVPRKVDQFANQKNILPGDQGIWATCDKGREGKCTAELRDLFNEYAQLLYSDELAAEAGAAGSDDEGDGEINIEADIQQELADIRKPQTKPLFWSIKLDVQCVIFFKTRAPVEPVSFVRRICEDAAKQNAPKRTRFCNRLSPMSLMGKATEDGLEKVAKEVLAPHFHQEPRVPKKFAIRPTIRNHNVMKRMDIIQKVASAVGPGHQVDLKNPDLLIMVEVYTSICGISVVPNDYDALKRYNLAEIFEPTPKEQPKKKVEAPKVESAEASKTEVDVKTETPAVKEEIEVPAVKEAAETETVAVKDETSEA
ncbi:Nop-domain-containing protein [Aureobasidium subglaciale]|nr:Nop-domain-containing protein [Aureobasidium subglaciale]